MNPALRASINSLVYTRMQGMIEPGDLDNQGKDDFFHPRAPGRL
jgi:hypothetical protein